jgi:hypothetical protein
MGVSYVFKNFPRGLPENDPKTALKTDKNFQKNTAAAGDAVAILFSQDFIFLM